MNTKDTGYHYYSPPLPLLLLHSIFV